MNPCACVDARDMAGIADSCQFTNQTRSVPSKDDDVYYYYDYDSNVLL